MGTIMNSNSDCERMFTFHTRIGRNPARNAMSQGMFDARIQIRSGTEASRDNCEKCDKNKNRRELGMKCMIQHDHCASAPVTDELRSNSKKAWSLRLKELDQNKNENAIETGFLLSRRRQDEDVKKEEENVFKLRLKGRNTFLPPNKMLRI